MGNRFLFFPTTILQVPSGVSKRYGYLSESSTSIQPLVLDAVTEAHRLLLGDKFSEQTCKDYLDIRSGQWLTKAFGRPAYYSGFTINGRYAYDSSSEYKRSGYMGYSFAEALIREGDAVEVYAFEDSNGMDYYLYFLENGRRVNEIDLVAGEKVELMLEGLMLAYGGPMTEEDRRKHRLVSAVRGAQLVSADIGSGSMVPIEGTLTDDEGRVSLTFTEPGTYYLSSQGGRCRYNTKLANPWLLVRVS